MGNTYQCSTCGLNVNKALKAAHDTACTGWKMFIASGADHHTIAFQWDALRKIR